MALDGVKNITDRRTNGQGVSRSRIYDTSFPLQKLIAVDKGRSGRSVLLSRVGYFSFNFSSKHGQQKWTASPQRPRCG